MKRNIQDEIKELREKITELEGMLKIAMQPLQNINKTTQQYLRIVNLLIERGGLSPDLILPELKDSISQEIVRALLDKPDQNISQITERVKNKRGTASRRIIRNKLKDLLEKNVVECTQDGSRSKYRLTEQVMKKWSQMLGFNI